jgi:predicted NBD/HSP70 family sugar kinase
MSDSTAQVVPSYLRELNERRVLEILREQGPAHAAHIARLASLSRPTSAQVLRALVDVGLVEEQMPMSRDPGRAKSMFYAVSTLGAVLSVDIGARFIRASVGDVNGTQLATASHALTETTLASVIKTMHSVVDEVLAESKYTSKDILSFVVGSPGVVDREAGQIAIAGTISELEGVKLTELLEKEFGFKPVIENDVNLVAIAEQNFGAGKNVDTFAVLSVGSGIGAGLIINGQIHRGHRGAAGEIFYIPLTGADDIRHNNSDPSSGNIESFAASIAKNYPDSKLVSPYKTIEIFKAARDKDSLALAVVANVAMRIALYISTITSVIDVESVVLSGGIGRQADVLLEEIRAVTANIVPYAPNIEVSQLGDNAVLLGASALGTKIAQNTVFARRSNAYSAARETADIAL